MRSPSCASAPPHSHRMPDILPIIRRKFSQQDRAAVQEQVSQAVEADSERFLAAYRLDSRSFQGRYVNSDLMKEMFPEYSASKEHRNRYNLPVHNAAAVLAARAVPGGRRR